MKKMTALALALILCLGMGTSALAQGKPASAGAPNGEPVNAAPGAQSAQIPGSSASVLFIPAYHITVVCTRAEDSDKVKVMDINWTDGPDEKEVTASFGYGLYVNGVYTATVSSTVRAAYSQLNNWSQMLSVSASVSGPYASNYSCSTSQNGSNGYLYIHSHGARIMTVTYTIATNGNLSEN